MQHSLNQEVKIEKIILSLIELAKIECDIHLENFLSEDMLKEQMRDLDEKKIVNIYQTAGRLGSKSLR